MARRNECRVDAAVTVDGRLFHALAAATRNAPSPSDDLLVAGTTTAGELVYSVYSVQNKSYYTLQFHKILLGTTHSQILTTHFHKTL